MNVSCSNSRVPTARRPASACLAGTASSWGTRSSVRQAYSRGRAGQIHKAEVGQHAHAQGAPQAAAEPLDRVAGGQRGV
jgi:hypothetical protein